MPKPNVRMGDWVYYHHSRGIEHPMVTMPALVTRVMADAEQRATLTVFPPPSTPGLSGTPADRLLGVLFSEKPERTRWSWTAE